MDSETTSAFIALAGTLVSVVVSFVTARLTYRSERNKTYNDSVTRNRHDWLIRMRKHISIMLAEARDAAKCNNAPESKKYFTNRNEVLIRLNRTEPYHCLLEAQIRELDEVRNIADYERVEKNIFLAAEPLLKTEWDKVRNEAKGDE